MKWVHGLNDSSHIDHPALEAVLNPERARAAGARLGGRSARTANFTMFKCIRREADSAIVADGRLFQFLSPEAQSAFWEGFWNGKNERVEEARAKEERDRICPICNGAGRMDPPFLIRPRPPEGRPL